MQAYPDDVATAQRDSTQSPSLIVEMLAAYEEIGDDVEAALRYIEDMHG